MPFLPNPILPNPTLPKVWDIFPIFFGKVGIEIRSSGQGSCLHLQKQTFKAIK